MTPVIHCKGTTFEESTPKAQNENRIAKTVENAGK